MRTTMRVPTTMSSRLSSFSFTTVEMILVIVSYLLCGVLHEVSHWICAYGLGVLDTTQLASPSSSSWVQLLFGRQTSIPINIQRSPLQQQEDEDATYAISIIRHTGWIFSCLLALVITGISSRWSTNKKKNYYYNFFQIMLWTCYATALEAIVTDLFQWTPQAASCTTTTSTVMTFFCGNFGLILLNPAWISAEGERGTCTSALKILQDMIRVTMMRGAQAGGIVTFEPAATTTTNSTTTTTTSTALSCKAIRSRVVNRKRTDLSEKIITKLQKDNKTNFYKHYANANANNSHATNQALTFSGHTRFATSSIADFNGTHPHQWSPPSMMRRVWDLRTTTPTTNNDQDDNKTNKSHVQAVRVENYVMHNGDFEFYELNGTTYDLETVQDFLEGVLCYPMPSATDSCAIAGMIDLLRTKGCFSLSARYALALGMPNCNMSTNSTLDLPKSFEGYEKFGDVFDKALEQFIQHQCQLKTPTSPSKVLAAIATNKNLRFELVKIVCRLLQEQSTYDSLIRPLVPFHLSPSHRTISETFNLDTTAAVDTDEETGGGHQSSSSYAYDIMDKSEDNKNSIVCFAKTTIDAFFDNDLLQTTKEFLTNAHGSFGLCVTSSLDAASQMCLAARGQTISIGFYPKSGLVLYGSEQAAVKAALDNVPTPGGDLKNLGGDHPLDRCAARLDLDDLGGEICLIDWNTGGSNPSSSHDFVSVPNRDLPVHTIMNNTVRLVLYQQSGGGQSSNAAASAGATTTTTKDNLFQRMTLLEGNDFIQPLREEPKDLVLADIQSIPRVCSAIQEDWKNAGEGISFNRLTALALSRSLIRRLEAISSGGRVHNPGSIDVLLTGCEVSLWLAEQMASDLKKAFTKLNIMAVSSNKILALFGQEQSIPAVGFPLSRQTHVLTDSIVIIVSHSGGTFGPLQCSNLLQSVTRNIFAVTSEWDCQIGKQLRSMYDQEHDILDGSRLFVTNVGLAPAEPCSLSVAATQQILTNILIHMSIVMIANPRYRHISGAVITERDLQILERCNRDNIQALEAICGVDAAGQALSCESLKVTVDELREIGDRWAEHVLENAKAYVMSFLYIVITVTVGLPLITGIGQAAGANESTLYFLRFLDSLLYFWLPQINITLLRLMQGRNLLHRMVARTVVIGDIPWVAQSAEAFLSKLFACSYSIAGLNVLSGNPSDHLVHRHTHRVVRGTLFCCGRPDGRLMSLTSAESAVLLSVNQASSIQSWGGRCESVTIGHNPFENPLCYRDIFLERFRPLFLCERVLDMTASPAPLITQESRSSFPKLKRASGSFRGSHESLRSLFSTGETDQMSSSFKSHGSSASVGNSMSSSALQGRYSTLQNESRRSLALQRDNGGKPEEKQRRKEERIDSEKRKAATVSFFERIMANATERDDVANISRHGRHKKFFDSSRHGSRVLLKREGSARDLGTGTSRHGRHCSFGSATSFGDNHGTPTGPSHCVSHAYDTEISDVLAEMQVQRTEISVAERVFDEYASGGLLNLDEFLAAYKFIDKSLTPNEAIHLFEEADLEDSGVISFDDFFRVLTTPHLKLQAAKNRTIRCPTNGLVTVEPAEGKYFDDDLYSKTIAGVSKIALAKSESLSMELYEARIASLQRFVSMTVMFHQLGHRVQNFFVTISMGLWGYRMDRTHSILRVATTASPASGAHVRKQMEVLRVFNLLNRAASIIAGAWTRYKANKIERLLMLDDSRASNLVKIPLPTSANTSLDTSSKSLGKPEPPFSISFDV